MAVKSRHALKNIGLICLDGKALALSQAYDIVAYGAYPKRSGHALHILPPDTTAKPRLRAMEPESPKAAKPGLTPSVLRAFCQKLDILEKPAAAVVRETSIWPCGHGGEDCKLCADRKAEDPADRAVRRTPDGGVREKTSQGSRCDGTERVGRQRRLEWNAPPTSLTLNWLAVFQPPQMQRILVVQCFG